MARRGNSGLNCGNAARTSQCAVDLDFFAPEHFDENALLQRLQVLPGFAVVGKAPFTVHATIGNTKVSFLGYAYPMLFPMLFQASTFRGVSSPIRAISPA
jgi:hypothetical protein